MELIVATRNAHKTREIEQIFGSRWAVRDLTAHPEISEIAEGGTSFEENAKLKAIAVSRELPGLVIADDSGLEVDALGGAPGVGYDPIFIPDGFEETFAELPEQVKNNISHRAEAVRKMEAELPTLCGEA